MRGFIKSYKLFKESLENNDYFKKYFGLSKEDISDMLLYIKDCGYEITIDLVYLDQYDSIVQGPNIGSNDILLTLDFNRNTHIDDNIDDNIDNPFINLYKNINRFTNIKYISYNNAIYDDFDYFNITDGVLTIEDDECDGTVSIAIEYVYSTESIASYYNMKDIKINDNKIQYTIYKDDLCETIFSDDDHNIQYMLDSSTYIDAMSDFSVKGEGIKYLLNDENNSLLRDYLGLSEVINNIDNETIDELSNSNSLLGDLIEYINDVLIDNYAESKVNKLKDLILDKFKSLFICYIIGDSITIDIDYDVIGNALNGYDNGDTVDMSNVIELIRLYTIDSELSKIDDDEVHVDIFDVDDSIIENINHIFKIYYEKYS